MNDTPSTAEAPHSHGPPAVLYVDDEPRSLKYFAKALQREFPVLTAGGAAEAKTVLQSAGERIGVLVSDQRMPVESGVQLLAQVKEQHPQIVRVLTTAYADLEAAVEAVNRGEIYRYILKPWDIEVLRTELRGAMNLYLRQRHEQELLQARRSTMLALAAQIAHELRTPLASVRAAMYGLAECMPELVQAYRRDAAHGERPPTLTAAHLRVLENTPAEVTRVVNRANSLINLLLMNAREEVTKAGHDLFSLAGCIREALASYPFVEGERELVRLEGEDFIACGSELLFNYVIYNLLKNALAALRGGDGGIIIRMQPGEPYNRVWFRDSGRGIPEEVLPRIFEEFYSGQEWGKGTGMGLPFCRRVMEGLGGGIQCRSRVGEYTEFELSFPRVSEHERGDE